MSKKSKKAQEAQVLDTSATAAEEAQTVEIAQTDVEVVPATIVESSEEAVFGAEPAVENGETAVATEEQSQPSEQETQTEQPAPKKPKVDRRPYIAWLTEQLEKPCDRRVLLKEILERWPAVSKGGCQTFLTDMLNTRYTYYKDRPVVKLADGKVVFADKAPAPAPVTEEATPPTTEPTEQPAA